MGLAQPRAARSDSRREILRVAEEIFAKKGYVATSTREIAEAVGVTKGLLFYHFRTKQQLYLTVIENLTDSLSRLAIPEQLPGLDRMAHIRSFIEGWTDFLAKHPDAQKLLTRELMDEGKFHKKIVEDYIKPLYDFGISFINDGIKEGVFRPVDAFQFLQMLTSTNVIYFTLLPFHERIAEKDLLTPEAIQHRKDELWKNFSRILRKPA